MEIIYYVHDILGYSHSIFFVVIHSYCGMMIERWQSRQHISKRGHMNKAAHYEQFGSFIDAHNALVDRGYAAMGQDGCLNHLYKHAENGARAKAYGSWNGYEVQFVDGAEPDADTLSAPTVCGRKRWDGRAPSGWSVAETACGD